MRIKINESYHYIKYNYNWTNYFKTMDHGQGFLFWMIYHLQDIGFCIASNKKLDPITIERTVELRLKKLYTYGFIEYIKTKETNRETIKEYIDYPTEIIHQAKIKLRKIYIPYVEELRKYIDTIGKSGNGIEQNSMHLYEKIHYDINWPRQVLLKRYKRFMEKGIPFNEKFANEVTNKVFNIRDEYIIDD